MSLSDLKPKLSKTIEVFKEQLAGIRTGRATPSLLESLEVEAYEGAKLKLKELATLSAPEPTLIVIQPWDSSVVSAIEKAIRNSSFGFNPSVDGVLIRVVVPSLTEERRKQLQKVVSEKMEEARIAVRSLRREEIETAERQKKSGDLPEDDFFRFQKDVQAEVDRTNGEIEKIGKEKEQELLNV